MKGRGFTLLEILLAIAISGLIVIALTSSYFQVLKAKEIVEREGEFYFHVRTVLERMERELSSLYYNSEGITSLFKGEENSLTFYSLSPSIAFSRYPAVKLTYYLDYGERGGILMRREEPFLTLEEKKKEFVWLRGVKEIKFEYFDGKEWKEEWMDKETLPGEIRVRLEMESGEEFSTVFLIPLGRWGS